jgi:hypothetical protein
VLGFEPAAPGLGNLCSGRAGSYEGNVQRLIVGEVTWVLSAGRE